MTRGFRPGLLRTRSSLTRIASEIVATNPPSPSSGQGAAMALEDAVAYALADAPDGAVTTPWNDNANTSDHASPVGPQSSAIRQNGQYVSGTDMPEEWMNQKGHRSEMVQKALAEAGRGSQG